MTDASLKSTVQDHADRQRFELQEGGMTAFADYRLSGAVLVIPHVEAPLALRGTGAAGRLMEGLLKIVKERRLKVIPACPYAAAYIRRHPELQDLLA